MIELYSWATSNGRKIAIALEEMGLAYSVHPINIYKDEQFHPDFAKINPNNKIPAIVDTNTGQTIIESGAILLYLANKTGAFLADEKEGGEGYWTVVQWLMWQMGGIGPMLGQAMTFLHYNPGVSAYAEERYGKEAKRLYSVLNARLDGRDYMAGTYSIADMAIWPWIARHEWQKIDLADYPNVQRWYREIAKRPAVQRAFKLMAEDAEIPGL